MATTTSRRTRPTATPPRRKSTLSLHGALVALAPARSVTSHARRAYGQRYEGRYRFAQAVFGFDLFLLCVILALSIFDLWIFVRATPPQDGGLTLSFVAAPLRAGDDMPVAFILHSRDGAIHEDVRLQWHLPEWVQIVRAEPRLARDGSVLVGRVAPGEDRTSIVVLRISASTGVDVPIDVSVQQTDQFGYLQRLDGKETRPVAASAISAGPIVPISRMVRGASIPVVVKNEGKGTLNAATFRIVEGAATVNGASSYTLGVVPPSSTRVVFVDLLPISTASTTIAWQVEDRAHVVTSGLIQPMFISALGPKEDVRTLTVIQQQDGTTVATFDQVPLAPDAHVTTVPLVQLADGSWAVGVSRSVTTAKTVPFRAEARYYSSAGDQVGVGPISPVVGQSTRYWIVWSVDPGSSGLKEVTMSGVLPVGVRATGQFASTVSGSFIARDRSVIWTVPAIPPSGGQNSVTFAFEAEITPTQTQESTQFIATSTIEALDAESSRALHAEAPGVTTLY